MVRRPKSMCRPRKNAEGCPLLFPTLFNLTVEALDADQLGTRVWVQRLDMEVEANVLQLGPYCEYIAEHPRPHLASRVEVDVILRRVTQYVQEFTGPSIEATAADLADDELADDQRGHYRPLPWYLLIKCLRQAVARHTRRISLYATAPRQSTMQGR